jgi:hypothetical protein
VSALSVSQSVSLTACIVKAYDVIAQLVDARATRPSPQEKESKGLATPDVPALSFV